MRIDKTMLDKIQQLERKIDVLTQLAQISNVLNSELELQPLLGYLMDAAAEITDSEAASVLLWSPQTRELSFAATTTSTAGLNLMGKPVPLEGSIAGMIMMEQRIIQVDDVNDNPHHYAKVNENTDFQTRSILGVPMTSKNRPIGVLEVLNKRALPWTGEDLDYLTILAAQAAVAIESAQLVQALQKANVELNELDKLKNDFISIASHELRTPLGVILGYASFLQETSSNEVNEHATKVLNSALQLRGIIEDMTNLRYLKQGQGEIRREIISLNGLLTEARNDILTLSDAKGHKVELVLPQEEIIIYVDPIRIGMAITNVLNNAVRFTPPNGRIIIDTEIRNSQEVWVKITDNGIGLTPEQVERVFEEFYQAEDHMTRRYGGLGIGLSIVKVLIEAHGGRVWASSPGLNQGTSLTMTLPLAQAAENNS
jgi:signal transduction histidine kinase